MTLLMSVKLREYTFSCIDSGYGGNMGLYEVCIFKKNPNHISSVLGETSVVKGWCDWLEVEALYKIFKSCPHTNWSKYGFSQYKMVESVGLNTPSTNTR